jgi:patatin-like phospholipase/acyl hydrolase
MRILSIDGGGYLGLASAALLAEFERHFGVSCHDSFDLFCGTSTGAIIALALAADIPAAEVVALYERIGPVVFPIRSAKLRWVHRRTVGFFRSQYQNEALRRVLHDVFKDGGVEGVKHSLLVVANADLRYEHANQRGPLTALLLTYNLFGDSFFEASCRLGGKSTGRCF